MREEAINSYERPVRKPAWEKPLWRHRHKWQDNITSLEMYTYQNSSGAFTLLLPLDFQLMKALS
jgi:hypothetical protein